MLLCASRKSSSNLNSTAACALVSTLCNALALTTTVIVLAITTPSIALAQETCVSSNSDPDGDGWGWENGSSCVVEGSRAATPASTQPATCMYLSSDDDGDGWGWENNSSCRVGADTSSEAPITEQPDLMPVVDSSGRTICQSANADPDGDGYGWENNASCIVEGSEAETTVAVSPVPTCTSSAADPDGDGWGWENNATCRVASNTGAEPDDETNATSDSGDIINSNTTVSTDNTETTDNTTADNTDTTDSSETPDITETENKQFRAEDITDLILITGQSNTLGSNTSWNTTLDAPHPRVFAYTSEGWRVAELYQSWDNGAHPGTGNRSDVEKIHNNFALHFGKRLAELDDNIVVGFVLVSEPGEGINHWAPGSHGKVRVQQKTLEAINALPSKTTIDGILWHQGETDWLLEGTSDPDVEQPAAIDYYPASLSALIENFRLENWYDDSRPFICGETIQAEGVNTHLSNLNSDDDPATACVEAVGLPAITAGGNHFNASALRTLGRRYAEAYIQLR